jgi:hypothetical protein
MEICHANLPSRPFACGERGLKRLIQIYCAWQQRLRISSLHHKRVLRQRLSLVHKIPPMADEMSIFFCGTGHISVCELNMHSLFVYASCKGVLCQSTSLFAKPGRDILRDPHQSGNIRHSWTLKVLHTYTGSGLSDSTSPII